jgi:SAM-dependent methyltransferase
LTSVRFLAADAGISQFLDIGAGLPTQGSVHEIAQAVSPGSRVVYVDRDEMVVSRARALTTDPNVAAISADARAPQAILDHPATRDLIDFTRPLAVLMVALLHFISDADDPARVVAVLRDAVAAGSYLVISHVTSDVHGDSAQRARDVYAEFMTDATLRTSTGITRLFDGFGLLDPGLVQVPFWRPDDPPPPGADKLWILGAVGRKPGVTSV